MNKYHIATLLQKSQKITLMSVFNVNTALVLVFFFFGVSQSYSIVYLSLKERADIFASYHKTVALARSIRMID